MNVKDGLPCGSTIIKDQTEAINKPEIGTSRRTMLTTVFRNSECLAFISSLP